MPRAYSSPSLTEFGRVVSLTAAGSAQNKKGAKFDSKTGANNKN